MTEPLRIITSRQMEHDRELMRRQGKNLLKLEAVIDMLANRETLEPRFNDHKLSGNWDSFRSCHIEPDWVLIYRIFNNNLELHLTRTGTHADLYGK